MGDINTLHYFELSDIEDERQSVICRKCGRIVHPLHDSYVTKKEKWEFDDRKCYAP